MLRSDTRAAILDAAEELIQTRGANGISYEHISRAVRIRKASIHYHFATKEKLIEEVLERYCARFLDRVDALFAGSDPAPVKLRKYTDLFEATLRTPPSGRVCLCGMLGAEMASLGSPAVARLQRFYKENGERLAAVLEQGRKKKTLRFQGDSKALGLLVFSLLEGAMMVARADGGAKRFRQLRKQALKLVGV
jgi:TetR/AcrR family transcriptional repressor of nem operon